VDHGEVLVSVARQVLSGAKQVETPEGLVPVAKTPSKGLLRVESSFERRPVVGTEQNPNTGSQWAKLPRAGHKVVQFRDAETGRYIANMVDGKVQLTCPCRRTSARPHKSPKTAFKKIDPALSPSVDRRCRRRATPHSDNIGMVADEASSPRITSV